MLCRGWVVMLELHLSRCIHAPSIKTCSLFATTTSNASCRWIFVRNTGCGAEEESRGRASSHCKAAQGRDWARSIPSQTMGNVAGREGEGSEEVKDSVAKCKPASGHRANLELRTQSCILVSSSLGGLLHQLAHADDIIIAMLLLQSRLPSSSSSSRRLL